MKTVLPARRFREAQWLIVATLVLLVAMVVVELQGMVTLARAAEEEARRGAAAAAVLIGTELSAEGEMRFRGEPHEGLGVALLVAERVVSRAGSAGPERPAWWPWASRAEWEKAGRAVAGPVRLPEGEVMVAYRAVDDQRFARVVLRVTSSPLLGQWRWVGAGLALLVAGAGGLLAIRLVGRVLAPYRDLMAEAERVRVLDEGQAEDRFLVETFRTTVRRLEDSEAALRQRADELAVLADVLTRESEAGVVIADAAGVVRASNATSAALLGVDLPVGRELPATLRGASGRTRLGERVIGVRRFPLRLADGAALGEVLFIADTTRVDALERSLAEREQLAVIGELSAGMAHELRNALATITGYLRLVGDADEAGRAKYVAAMQEEAAGLTALLERFMRFSQPQHLRKERVDLRHLAAETVERVRGTFPSVAFVVRGPDTDTEGDPLALGVALENLVRNAAEAVEARAGRVTVEVEGGAETVRVRVSDDGPGVSPEVSDRLFAPFASTKPSGGLGLALARRFARLHGGDVQLLPPEQGRTRFELRLPRRSVT
ncbi:MAG: sensor histidine kinase [Acidobacteriota bacterium]